MHHRNSGQDIHAEWFGNLKSIFQLKYFRFLNIQTQHLTFHFLPSKQNSACNWSANSESSHGKNSKKKCSKSSRQFSHAKLHYFALTDSQTLKPKPTLMLLSSLSHMQGNGETRMRKIFMHIHEMKLPQQAKECGHRMQQKQNAARIF